VIKVFLIKVNLLIKEKDNQEAYRGLLTNRVMPRRTHATVQCPHCDYKTTSGHLQRHLTSLHPDVDDAEAILDQPAAPHGLNCK
jgi:hypothetical protein